MQTKIIYPDYTKSIVNLANSILQAWIFPLMAERWHFSILILQMIMKT